MQIYTLGREAMRPVELGIHLLHACIRQGGEEFAWRERGAGAYLIDLLAGTDGRRRDLDSGVSPAEIASRWAVDAAAFVERRRPYLLYPE